MPELPEVETVKETLKTLILGKAILEYEVKVPRMERTSLMKIEGETINDIRRRGKYIIFVLDHYAMISHLRMEGKYYFEKQTRALTKHEHAVFRFFDGSELIYHDVRKFGTFDLISLSELDSFFDHLGVEPNSAAFTPDYLWNRRNTQNLKTFLLDQKHIAGLGNIYVNEVMFLMNRHPLTRINQLRKKEMVTMVEAVNKTISRAIALGGTTIRSYTSSLGVTGRFQNELYVHGKAGETCEVCGDMILKMKVSGRGTYYCPTCQAKRR